jgi:hypothetical protein
VGALGVDLLTALLALTVLYARPVTVLGVLLGTTLLIPATLVTPHLHTSYATVNHVLIAAAALRVLAMARRGDLSRARFRVTPFHLALVLLVATWGVAGVVFAPTTEVPGTAMQRLVALIFVVAFFVVALALLREIDDPMLIMRTLTGFLAVTAVIAVVEHFTRASFGHWLFQQAGHPGPTTAAHVLETRAGHVRVRASGEFALAYAWVAVMLLPVAILVALRMRRAIRIGVPIVALVLLAIYWTYSRSAAAAVPAVFILVALAVRDRRTLFAGGATALGALLLFAADPTVRHHLSLTTDQGSVGIRFQRLPPILEAVSHHPFLGLGLGGLQSIGFVTTDNFYLAAYSETGVVGAAMLVVVCVTALAQAVRGITVTDRVRRAAISTSLIGFVAFLASGLFDDALLLSQPAQLAVLLVAIATATAEPELGFVALPKLSLPRTVFLTAAGALIGLAAYLAAPVVVSQERVFTTVSDLGTVAPEPTASGPALIGTVCDLAKVVGPSLPDTHIDCRDNFTAPGVGTLRVESRSSGETLQAYTTLKSVAARTYYLSALKTFPAGPPIAARATAWDTAPVSGAVLGLALALIAPLPLRRRRTPAPAPSPTVDRAPSIPAPGPPPRQAIPALDP